MNEPQQHANNDKRGENTLSRVIVEPHAIKDNGDNTDEPLQEPLQPLQDYAPFRWSPDDLMELVVPHKNRVKLDHLGGVNSLLNGLLVDIDHGLCTVVSDPAAGRVQEETAVSVSVNIILDDSRKTASASLDGHKNQENSSITVPIGANIVQDDKSTIYVPKRQSSDFTPKNIISRATSVSKLLDMRRHIYGSNTLPPAKPKTLFQCMLLIYFLFSSFYI
jgi:hypothetical protein